MVSAVSHRARYKDDGHAEDPPLPPARPDPVETVERDPDAYDDLDEAAMESFPASDPPAVRGPRPDERAG
jgi:hypothetical protein